MDNRLAAWLIPWLNRPGWQLLAAQWGVLAGVVLLASTLLVSGEWQLREQLFEQRQQLERQISERRQQLSQLPAPEELQKSLQEQRVKRPDEQEDIGSHLYQLGGVLLRWQQQEKPAQQKVSLQLGFEGLLSLLAGISPTRQIGQMRIERQPEGLVIQLTLLATGEAEDE